MDMARKELCVETCETIRAVLNNFFNTYRNCYVVDYTMLFCESCKVVYHAQDQQPLDFSAIMLDQDGIVVEIDSLLEAVIGTVDDDTVVELKISRNIIDYLFYALSQYAEYLRENGKLKVINTYKDKKYTVELKM